MWLKVLITVIILKIGVLTMGKSVGVSQKTIQRLPQIYDNVEYILSFNETNIDEMKFLCVGSISFTLREATNELKFHSKNLAISEALLITTGPPSRMEFEFDKDLEIAIYKQDSELPQNVKIEIAFVLEGAINNDELEGFYVKKYKEGESTK